MITLGGQPLPDLVIDQMWAIPPVDARVARTLGGMVHVWEGSVSGRSIDLVGTENSGWIDRAGLDGLFAMASVPGATYELVYEGNSRTVRFRHEDAPVIEATPIVPRPNAESGDRHYGVRIRLMEM